MINNDGLIIKVFESFEDLSKPSPSIDAMMSSYGCVYKRSSKPVMKGSRVETLESAREEYKKLLAEGWKKLLYLIAISSDTERHEAAKLVMQGIANPRSKLAQSYF